MRLGLLCQRLLHAIEGFVDAVDGIADIEPEIGCNLIVARPRRVKAARRRADQGLEAAFDVHVHVFERY